MNYSTYRASLDIHASGSQAVLHAKKGETKRRILITLTERGKPYLISSDCKAVFTATKPDGNIIYNDCAIDNNIICYNFTEQTTAAEGKLDCEIRLYGADNALIISPGFDLIVDAPVYEDGDVIESGTEVSALTALVSETNTLISTVNTKLENGEFNGPAGEAGGWYTPAVTQPAANTMRVAFSPSKKDMPAIPHKDITLPGGTGGGVTAPVAGFFTMSVDDAGNLYAYSADGDIPDFSYDKETGDLSVATGPEETLIGNVKGPKGANGANGKSAYQYAVDGGYTGTETEFAAKMAAEKFANPNALTFTGAVTGSYDGSAPLRVEIPSGGEKWETILDLTLEEGVNKVVLMSGEVGYKKIVVYMKSVPPTDQTVTANQAISIYSGETKMTDATAKLNAAYLYNGNRFSGVSIELTPYAANVFASGATGWSDSEGTTASTMGYSSKNSLSKPIKKLTAQVWGNALFGVGSWFKVYGVRV